MEKMKFETADLAAGNIDKIAALFPNVITETKDANGLPKKAINFELLKQMLVEEVIEGNEAYEFTWVGKKASIREAHKPIRKTLRPCKEESVDWDTTQNLYIEGDNLEVLKLLQESYLGKVKMIYIDPPYNTGNDFIYADDFKMSTKKYAEETGVFDEDGNRMFKNADTEGRFHSDWCSMIYSRLLVARNLLSQDGLICVSIDDNEQENAKKLLSEIFGERNHVATFIIIRSEGGGLAKQAVIGHDYMLVYAKDITSSRPLAKPKDIRGEIVTIDGEEYWIETDWLRKVFGKYGTCLYEDIVEYLGENKKAEIDEGIQSGKYVLLPNGQKHMVGRYRKIADDSSKFYTIVKHLNKRGAEDLETLGISKKIFSFPKPVSLLKEFIQGVTLKTATSHDIILDFFSGSATTAHAVMQQNAEDGGNRHFILVQLPEACDTKTEAYQAGYANICDIGRARIHRAGAKIKEEHPEWKGDTGFRVLKVASTNMKNVYYAAGEYSQKDLSDYATNIKEDRTDLDLLFQCLLEWGLPLSLPHCSENVGGYIIHNYNNGDLIACFEKDIPEEVIRTIARQQPLRAVFRDNGFADDSSKINVEETFKLLAPATSIKVI